MGALPEKALNDLSDDLELGRDVLDKQVVDRDGIKMGRVDGLVLEVREGHAPRIEAIEMGGVVLAARIHPRLARKFPLVEHNEICVPRLDLGRVARILVALPVLHINDCNDAVQ